MIFSYFENIVLEGEREASVVVFPQTLTSMAFALATSPTHKSIGACALAPKLCFCLLCYGILPSNHDELTSPGVISLLYCNCHLM